MIMCYASRSTCGTVTMSFAIVWKEDAGRVDPVPEVIW
jgi:hypothetical protein